MNKKEKKPSVYTEIYWLIQDRKIAPESLFNFLELYWPTFIRKDKYIFIKEKFSEEEYNRLINEKANPEYWINLLTVDNFFSEITNRKERSMTFAKILVEIWHAKLKKNFPNLSFIVKYLHDEEYDDFGLTFYQKR